MKATLQDLGSAKLVAGGQEVRLPAKSVALLSYILESPRLCRDVNDVTRLLWPGKHPTTGRRSLNQAVYTVRKTLGPDAIRSAAGKLFVEKTCIESWAAHFRQMLRSGDFDSAIDIYKGDFLEGLLVTESEFADWRNARAALYRRELNRIRATAQSRAKEPAPTVRPSDRFPFLGRESEREVIRQWITAAHSCVRINGVAGIGKTTLAAAVLDDLSSSHRVFSARCYKSALRTPFGVLAALLRDAIKPADLAPLNPPQRSALSELIPSLHPSAHEAIQVTGEHGRHRLFAAITAVLRAASLATPIAWFIDDLQWADEASLSGLAEVVLNLKGHPFSLLITTREESYRPEVIDFLGTIEPTSLTLRELGDAAISQIVQAVRPDWEITHSELAIFAKRMKGHPIFVQEALGRSKNAALTAVLTAPYFIREYEALDEDARDAVEILGIVGVPLTLTSLAATLGVGRNQLETRLSHAHSFLRTGEAADTVALRHDLLADTVTGQLSRGRAQFWALSYARQLARERTKPSLAARLFHFAGATNDAFEQAVLAAHEAENVYACVEAQHFFEMASQCAPGVKDLYDVESELARMLIRHERYDLALPIVERLLTTAHRLGYGELEWQILRATCLGWSQSATIEEKTRAFSLALNQALDAKRPELALQMLELQARLHHTGFGERDEQGIRDLANDLASFAEGAHGENLRVQGAYIYSNFLATSVSTSAAVSWLQFAAERDRASQLSEQDRGDWSAYTSQVLYLAGLLRDLGSVTEKALSQARVLGLPARVSLIAASNAAMLMELGRFDEAEAALAEASTTIHGTIEITKLNWAWVSFNRGNYAECLQRINSGGDAPTRTQLTRNGLRGLSLIEMGQVREGFTIAGIVERQLSSLKRAFTDISPAGLLVSRVAFLTNKGANIQGMLSNLVNIYNDRDYCCWLRLRLALAEATARHAPDPSMAECQAVENEALARGLLAIASTAQRLARRIARSYPTRRFVKVQ